MKKFSEFFTESILEKEKTKQEVDSIINEGIVDGFKKLASAGKEKLSKFKDTFADKAKELLSKTLGTLVKSLVSSIQSKDKKPADIKSQMESNPLFKDFLSETNAIEEIKSDFSKEDVEDVVKKEDNVTKESIEEYYKQNNIITEDFGDMADTITTKIFSSVYKIIAGALGAIGWVIKPSFRNWFDKLVRKVQKLFYRSKLGQSIKDLPPEVEQSVMEKFQAIIGIVVVVVMVWIIVSHIKGEGDSIGTGGDSEAGDLPAKGLNDPGATEEMTNNPAYINGYKAYREARIAAIMKEHPSLSRDAIIRDYRTDFMAEYNTAWHNGNMLQVNDGDISQTPIPKSDGTETATTSADNTSTEGKTDGTDQTTNTQKPSVSENTSGSLSNELEGEKVGSIKARRLKVGDIGKQKYTDASELWHKNHNIYRLKQEYIKLRASGLTNFKSGSVLRKMQRQANREFLVLLVHGKVPFVKDGNVLITDIDNVPQGGEGFSKTLADSMKSGARMAQAKAELDALHNPQEYLKTSEILNGNNADFTKIDSDISRFNLNQIIESGAKSITMQSGDTPIKINIENLPDADKKLNPSELLDKYLSSYL